MNVSENIKRARNLKGYSIKYMAEQLEVPEAVYVKMENDDKNLTFEKIEKIANILEIPFLDLLTSEKSNIFNHCSLSGNFGNHSTYNTMPGEMKKIYEDRIKQMEKENEYIKKIYEQRVKQLEKENEYFKKIIDKHFLDS